MFWYKPPSFGAIAQLGERLNGIQEVGGSRPPSSTKNYKHLRHFAVGAFFVLGAWVTGFEILSLDLSPSSIYSVKV